MILSDCEHRVDAAPQGGDSAVDNLGATDDRSDGSEADDTHFRCMPCSLYLDPRAFTVDAHILRMGRH